MELDDHGFLEELLSFRRDPWEPFLPAMGDLFFNGDAAALDCLQQETNHGDFLQSFVGNSSVAAAFDPLSEQAFDALSEVYCPPLIGGGGGAAVVAPPDAQMLSAATAETGGFCTADELAGVCKMEVAPVPSPAAVFGTVGSERKKKKAEGVPSKNLMAERRRRKRLNDRLSMLRSVVPKISKMDRTSILGDTIDYMKELLERIKSLREEIDVGSDEQGSLLGIFKELNPSEMMVRNSPKFEVERRNGDTKIEICCAARPGLLLSTVNTLEALGLEIQQCVVSCFNDFGMQASCSEDVKQRAVISCEEIKQALFRNAGYGGRCLS